MAFDLLDSVTAAAAEVGGSKENTLHPSPVERCHPLLRVLRMMLVEAHRYHTQSTMLAQPFQRYHAGSIKALFRQLDYFWEEFDADPSEKYEFLRSRLSLVYLWHADNSHSLSRCMMNPPAHLPGVFRQHRQRVLAELPPGELFVHHSSP
ncbi:Hypothetical protein, putative [Bodo saltans]|uniref:Uncharacterized protein n=1 Tax=Bodo saltans TaxID=75058 RepID=A0A0S4KM15_BODSA|nr:Hypothetical protein, putative [Bodo saltans]|eukprot:CUI15635.1 Hypothetical protein, putative [Bodo saltans]